VSEPLDLSTAVRAPEGQGLWARLQRGLNRTHTELLERVGAAMQGRAVLDEEAAERLEEALIAADLGVSTSGALVERLRRGLRRGETQDGATLRQALRREIEAMIGETPPAQPLREDPAVILLIGVNGVGKTTTIAKLARREQLAGRRVLLAAGDTFRAAAGEQLESWSKRLGVELVRQHQGGDPAAVVFDAVQAAKARGIERLIVDTAGRLHTQENLMAELAKIGRVLAREAPAWQRRTWLVLDATTGQNAIAQAREFTKAVPVDGLILTKLDGTAKGGVAIAVARELGIPIVFLGVGESTEDLVDFAPQAFAAALLD
jgi:fused signal recognition particle receptor